MQRMLVTVAVMTLVLASLCVGALAAHWPFWHRAWQWHAAPDHWPMQLAGPQAVLKPAARPLPLRAAADARLVPRAGDPRTELILVGDVGGWAAYWNSPATDLHAPVDGRELAATLLAPLFGALQQQSGRPVLDQPLRVLLAEWQEDARGEITPRQLLREMSGLSAGDFTPLNPFSPRAQLASGPDFSRAALQTPLVWPPGSHFEPTPANTQLLALVAGTLDGRGFAEALHRHLWGRFAEHEAVAAMDHRRGNMAAHCCLRAAPLDWLRLGLLLAGDGAIGGERLLPEGFVAQIALASPVHPGFGLGFRLADLEGATLLIADATGRRLLVSPRTGRAVLWIGSGNSPEWLSELLLPGMFGPADSEKGG